MSYSATLSAGGEVVIPAKLCRELGFNDGEWMVIERGDNGIVVKTYQQKVREMSADLKRLRDTRDFNLDGYLAERHAEATRENSGK